MVRTQRGPKIVPIVQMPPFSDKPIVGGFAIAPVVAAATAVHKVGEKVKPFTRASNWLSSSSMFDGRRESAPYKVFKGIADTGSKLLGWGKIDQQTAEFMGAPSIGMGYPNGYTNSSQRDAITFTPRVAPMVIAVTRRKPQKKRKQRK